MQKIPPLEFLLSPFEELSNNRPITYNLPVNRQNSLYFLPSIIRGTHGPKRPSYYQESRSEVVDGRFLREKGYTSSMLVTILRNIVIYYSSHN